MKWYTGLLSMLAALAFLAPIQLHAQENPSRLVVQLNKLQTVGSACRVTFVMTNHMGVEIKSASLEIVLFDKQQAVANLLAVNPGRLPSGKTRVKQFDLKDVSCDEVGRALLNDIKRCDGDGLTPSACLDAARPSSRIDVPFGN